MRLPIRPLLRSSLLLLSLTLGTSKLAAAIEFRDSGQRLVGNGGSAGSSVVALGDMDGDGDLDAVGVQDNTGGFHRLWLNDGHGVFTLSHQFNGPFSANARNVTLADVDGDADLDLVFLTNHSGAAILVYINQGVTTPGIPPTFIARDALSAPALCNDVAVGQLNGTGGVDLVVVGSGSTNAVWFGDGTGVFTRAVETLTTDTGQAVALGDLDGDTHLDAFALFGGGTAPRRVLLNPAGAGTLVPNGQTWGGVFSPGRRLALGDLDGDGDLDSFVATLSIPSLEVWLNQGGAQAGTAGRFLLNGQTLSPTETGQDVALGDLDRDGDLDALVGRGGPNKVYVNDGHAQFTEATGSVGSLVGGTLSLALGDLDGDGDLDAFLGKQGIADEVWLNDTVVAPPSTQGTLFDSGQALGEDYTYGVALGDVDGDGDLDAVTAGHEGNPDNPADDPGRVWINQGRAQSGQEGTFSDSGQHLAASAADVVLGDVDRDGDLDAVFVGFAGSGAVLFTNLGGAQAGVPGNFVNSLQSRPDLDDVVLADFDGDGDLDLFASGQFHGDRRIYANLGGAQAGTTGVFSGTGVSFVLAVPRDHLAWADAVVLDADGDGDLDLAQLQQNGGEVVLWTNPGTIATSWIGTSVLSGLGSLPKHLRAGDVDLDGDADLVSARDLAIGKNLGGGSFQLVGVDSNRGDFHRPLALGDVNGDGRLDAVAGGYHTRGEVAFGGAGPIFTQAQTLSVGICQDVALGDLDGDGDLDAWFATTDFDRVWLNGESDLAPVLSCRPPFPGRVPPAGGRRQIDFNEYDCPIVFQLSTPHTAPVEISVNSALVGPVTLTVAPGQTTVQYVRTNAAIGAGREHRSDRIDVTIITPGVKFIGPLSFDLDMSQPSGLPDNFGSPEGCLIDSLDFYVFGAPNVSAMESRPASLPNAGRAMAAQMARLDLPLYRRLRDEVLADTPAGRYYTNLYETLSPELTSTALHNPVLLWQAYRGLIDWAPAVQALADGQGSTFVITGTMAGELSRFLDDLRGAVDDDVLRGKIDAEITALDLGSWVGLSMNTLLARVENQTRPSPTITTHPVAQTVAAGGAVTLSTDGDGDGPFALQWFRDGVAIAGATGSRYTLPSVQIFNAGNYTVTVANPFGSATSNAAALAVNTPPASNARLLNLSTRARSLTGDNVLIPGFVISGNASKRLLIRAVGPTLAGLGVSDVLADPRMVLKRYDPATSSYVDLDSNDTWGANMNAAEIVATSTTVGAFALQVGSADAALLVDLQPGQYSVVASGVNNTSGIAIVELYDADPASPTPGSRLINISNRGFAGAGTDVMIPGFVVSAEGPKTVLMRVVGPTLAQPPFGVAGTMVDPLMRVYRSEGTTSTLLFTNDDWGTGPDASVTTTVAQQVGAFPLSGGSKDAALVLTLAPGIYTVHGAAADGAGTGVVLAEVYIVP